MRSLVEEGKILHYDFSDWYGSDVGMRVKDVCPPPLKLAQQVRMAEAMPATRAWLEKVQARPAYKAMLDVGV